MKLGALAAKVRSKNAGPFWVTVDIFFDDKVHYQTAVSTLDITRVAALFGTETQVLKRFDIDALQVIKLSLPRPAVQGTAADRDMHGASFAVLLSEMELNSGSVPAGAG